MVAPLHIRLLVGCAALAVGGGVCAQTPDWRGAGGDLFVQARPARPALSKLSAPEAAIVRLPSPNQPLEAAVNEAATRHGLDPKLLRALVIVESGYRADAVSPAGAAGLTQLMPATASDLGVADRFDAAANLAGGAEYLAKQILRFGDVRLALAAFNAGPERVARLGRIPDIAETRGYVAKIVDCYLALTAGRQVLSARDCRAAETPR